MGDWVAASTDVASTDDRCSSPHSDDHTSALRFGAVAGTTYHIAVSSYRPDAAGQAGAIVLRRSS